MFSTRKSRRVVASLLGLFLALGVPGVTLAHESPEGAEWILADWMFLSFAVFAGSALVVFLIVLKAGLLSNLEDAKYPMLEIEEEDYYTPDWAKIEIEEGDDDTA